MGDATFWQALDALAASAELRVDRPRGSRHPRFPDVVYPLDYGYLAGTRSFDGDGIDVWVGSLPDLRVTGAILSVDLAKRDGEVELLLGCTTDEARLLRAFHQSGAQSALLLVR